MAHPGGRPTKYNPQVLVDAKAYIDGGYEEDGEVVPTIEGLSLAVGIARKTVYTWAGEEDKQEFSHMVEHCNAKQAKLLMSGALSSVYNSNIAKLMLTKQGYSDKAIQEVTGANGGAIKTDNKWTVEIVGDN